MTAPVLTTANLTKPSGTEIPFLDLFSVTDQANVLEYQFWQTHTAYYDSLGRFFVNGVVQPLRTELSITPAQAALTKYVVGPYPEMGIQIRARNADGWSVYQGAWAPFAIRVEATTVLHNPSEGLGVFHANLPCRCDNLDTFHDWNIYDWTNDLGKIRIVRITGALGGDFHVNPEMAEPVGQYNCGVQFLPQGSEENKATIFGHSPTVFVPAAFTDNWIGTANFPAPGIIVNNGDVLRFIANAFSGYVEAPGFFWQENFTVFFEKIA